MNAIELTEYLNKHQEVVRAEMNLSTTSLINLYIEDLCVGIIEVLPEGMYNLVNMNMSITVGLDELLEKICPKREKTDT